LILKFENLFFRDEIPERMVKQITSSKILELPLKTDLIPKNPEAAVSYITMQ